MSTQTSPALVDETSACKLLGGENTPVHRSTLWRWISEGHFPRPIKMGPGLARWRVSEINEFIEARAAERGSYTPPPGVVAAAELKRGRPGANPYGRRGKKSAAKRKGR